MKRFWMRAWLLCIFLLSPSVITAAPSPKAPTEFLVERCNEELGLYESELKSSDFDRYLRPKDWKVRSFGEVVVVLFQVKHNFSWLRYLSSYDDTSERQESVLLYGIYEAKYGWLWYLRSNHASLPEGLEEVRKNRAVLEETVPVGIIPAEKGLRQMLWTKLLCRRLIRVEFLPSASGGPQ